MATIPHVIREGQSYRKGQFALPKYEPKKGQPAMRIYDPPDFMPDGKKTKSGFRKTAHRNSIPQGYAVNEQGQQICGVWSSSTRLEGPHYCLVTELAANGRCDNHGGRLASLVPATLESNRADGTARAVAKRKERSRDVAFVNRYGHKIPKRLLDDYERSLKDKDILSVQDEMALMTARIGDLQSKMQDGEAPGLWIKLREMVEEYEDSATELQPFMLKKIFDTIRRGSSDAMAWRDINATVEQRRKLSETERKLLETKQQFITAQQAAGLVGGMANIVLRYVHDEVILAQIKAELAMLMNRGAPIQEPTLEEELAEAMAE